MNLILSPFIFTYSFLREVRKVQEGRVLLLRPLFISGSRSFTHQGSYLLFGPFFLRYALGCRCLLGTSHNSTTHRGPTFLLHYSLFIVIPFILMCDLLFFTLFILLLSSSFHFLCHYEE